MESNSQIPSFTISLRGYDRVEVDEYLDSLADTFSQVGEAQEHNQRLQSYIVRLNNRIKDLEDRISTDTPKTGAVLAERIGLLLSSAEETATDTIKHAEEQAAEVASEAEAKMAEADETARDTVARSEEQARQIEASARATASEILSEAESRASSRTRQIEKWAEQVVSHTRAEEAQMLREMERKREVANAELRALGERRDALRDSLAKLHEAIGASIGIVATSESQAVVASPAEGTGAGNQADQAVESGKANGNGAANGATSGNEGPATVVDLVDSEDEAADEAQAHLAAEDAGADDSPFDERGESKEEAPSESEPDANREDPRSNVTLIRGSTLYDIEAEATGEYEVLDSESTSRPMISIDDFEHKFEAWSGSHNGRSSGYQRG